VILKPSELSTAVSTLISELVPRYLDKELYQVVNGAVPETTRVRSINTLCPQTLIKAW
jgi:aldehyde dehydrogenase (NAD+)